MDMSKYKGMFLAEAREHLQNMGALLLAIEKDPGNTDDTESLFREAHSIKGMAASMGYVRTAELAHCLEDLMSGFRRSGTVPASAVDRLLAGIDLLEGLLEDISSGREEREIGEFFSGQEPGKSAPEQPSAPSEPRDSAEFKGKEQDLRLSVEFNSDAAAPAARALLILRELAGWGRVFSSSPSEEDLRKGAISGRMEVQLATKRSSEDLRLLIGSMSDVKKVDFSEPSSQKLPAPPRPLKENSRTVRVRTALLDRLINLTGELITNRYMLETAFRDDRETDVQEGLHRLKRLISELQHQVLQARMMPLESITGHLPRLVRTYCRKTGKKIALRIQGEEVELDRAILETLSDPLMHMVRNAIDHGIEKEGEVRILAYREKDMVILEISDDGRGMDPATIRDKSVEKGLLNPEQALVLRERDILQLICRSGFSTASQVTETSGRGVGMDVVKSSVENLGGSLDIFSSKNHGTRFLLKFPLSVAIIQILLVECSGHLLGIPITRIHRTQEFSRRQVSASGGGLKVSMTEIREGEVVREKVPLLSMRKMLDMPPRPPSDSISVVISDIMGRKVGLVVDRLVGHREVFVKSLAPPLDRFGGLAGATILGDGSVIFIVDPPSLLEKRTSVSSARTAGAA